MWSLTCLDPIAEAAAGRGEKGEKGVLAFFLSSRSSPPSIDALQHRTPSLRKGFLKECHLLLSPCEILFSDVQVIVTAEFRMLGGLDEDIP